MDQNIPKTILKAMSWTTAIKIVSATIIWFIENNSINKTFGDVVFLLLDAFCQCLFVFFK